MVAIVGLVLVASGCKGDEKNASASGRGGPALEPKTVQLVTASEQLVGSTVVGNGTLAADEQATLAFKVPGRITAISVDLGTSVRRGDVIARLDTSDYELRVSQAEAAMQQARVRLGLDPRGGNDKVDLEATGTVRQARAVLDEAKANFERGKQLFESGVIARAQLDSFESAYRVAEARYQDALEEVRNRQGLLLQRKSELELARQQLADTVLRAPFDGAISERTATIGEFVNAGAQVALLVRLNPLRMRAEIPEREASGISNGQAVIVKAEGRTETARGRVARISPVISQEARVLLVEIEVDNAGGALRPGGFARAEIAKGTAVSTIMVPESAVVDFAGIQKVFTIADGKASEQIVSTGRREEGQIEITRGLDAGTQVVADPGNLVTGQPVIVQ
jgi:RND family efflux transporter MFP subunit